MQRVNHWAAASSTMDRVTGRGREVLHGKSTWPPTCSRPTKQLIAFDEGERKPNSVLRPVSFELVCLCTVMRNESSRNARADVWATNWPPRLIFAEASIGRETGATIF